MRKMKYDIVVVGGGPGGAVAAKTCAEKGLSVLLIEKRSKIGDPVRCGELIPDYVLKEFEIGINDCFNATDVFDFISPEQQRISFDFPMHVLDRRIFDSDLVSRAEDAGADIWLQSRALDLISGEGAFKGVKVNKQGVDMDVRANIVIAADGVESTVGRMAGINTTLNLKDIGSAAAAVVKGIDVERNVLKEYFLKDFIPGYLWIFPKSENTANIGVILSLYKDNKPITLLNYYMKHMKTLRGAEICYYTSGGVPEALRLEKLFFKNILFVGDAARLSNPIGGDGLPQAMLSGKLAGETAVKSNEYDDLHILKEYDKKWKNERYDSYQYELYTAKEMLLSMSISSRAELSEKLWLTAARDCAYPFRASNVMKQRNAQLQYLKVLVGDNRLRKWALEQSLKILQEKLKFCWI